MQAGTDRVGLIVGGRESHWVLLYRAGGKGRWLDTVVCFFELHCTVYSAQCTVYSEQWTVDCVQPLPLHRPPTITHHCMQLPVWVWYFLSCQHAHHTVRCVHVHADNYPLYSCSCSKHKSSTLHSPHILLRSPHHVHYTGWTAYPIQQCSHDPSCSAADLYSTRVRVCVCVRVTRCSTVQHQGTARQCYPVSPSRPGTV